MGRVGVVRTKNPRVGIPIGLAGISVVVRWSEFNGEILTPMSSEVGFMGEATVKGISFTPVDSVEGTHRKAIGAEAALEFGLRELRSSGELSEICTITGGLKNACKSLPRKLSVFFGRFSQIEKHNPRN